MRHLVKMCEQKLPTAEIVLVASDKPCAGIDFANAKGLPTALINRQNYDSQHAHEKDLANAIETAVVDWIFLAGYMAVLTTGFVSRFAGRILNIHPSLLPAFKGLDTHQRALDAGATQHGATVHIVKVALDDGPIVLQAGLKISDSDTAKTLAERVLQLEHQLFPFVLLSLVAGKLTLTNAVPRWVDRSNILAEADEETIDFLNNYAIWPN